MKRFKRGQKGFTLVELLIVVAILGILAAVVIPNVVGLMGRGGAQAYETDQEVIQLAAATFYSDVHGGWDDVGDNDNVGTYDDNVWGAADSTDDAGHFYPTAIATVGGHGLRIDNASLDPDGQNNPRLVQSDGTTPATLGNVSDHAIWMGLLINAQGDGTDNDSDGTLNRGPTVSVELLETGLYLQELPESAMYGPTGATSARNGAAEPGGGYCWVVGKNGTVYGVYQASDDDWYAGYGGAYP